MSVKLRLQRTGRKNRAQFRVVAADCHSPRDGKCLETLGWYNPHGKSEADTCHVDVTRIDAWIAQGAQPSPSVKQIVKRFKKIAT